jgi:Tfp pilus assembly protein PilF
MRHPTVAALVIAAAAAAAVSGVDTAGWLWWGRVVKVMNTEPQSGVDRIINDTLLRLPSAVQRTRRLATQKLLGANTHTVIRALERVASYQKSWLWTDPSGFQSSAVAALLDGRPTDGLRELRLALSRDPTSPYLHRVLALVYHRAGRREECLDHLAEVNAHATSDMRYRLDLAEQDRLWIRLEGLRRRLHRYPRQLTVNLLALARELRHRGEYRQAERLLLEHQDHPDVAIELARWELDAGRPDEATGRVLDIAERSSLPSDVRVRAWSALAEIRARVGDPSGAAAAAREALRLDSGSAAPHLALATIAERRGADEEALQHLRRAWGVAPADVSILLRVATVAERAGHLDDARLALERAVDVEPGNPAMVARIVDFHLRHSEYMDAAMRLSRGLDRFPTDQRLLRLADRLRREVGNRP